MAQPKKKDPKAKSSLRLNTRKLGRLPLIAAMLSAVFVGALGYYVYDNHFSAQAGGWSYLFANQSITAHGCKTRVSTAGGVTYNIKILYTKAPGTRSAPYALTVVGKQTSNLFWKNQVASFSATVRPGKAAAVQVGSKTNYYASAQIGGWISC